jgi:hypothetical protein
MWKVVVKIITRIPLLKVYKVFYEVGKLCLLTDSVFQVREFCQSFLKLKFYAYII